MVPGTSTNKPATGPDTASPARDSLARRILLVPVFRIVLAMVAASVPMVLVQIVARPYAGSPIAELIAACVSIPLSFLAYAAYVRLVERRSVAELAFAGGPAELGRGMLVGAGLFTLTIGILWILGSYHVTGSNAGSVLVASLGMSISSGFVEELIMRGIFFRIVEESLGTWIALLISAILFGALHAGNPHATVTSSAAIALEAGMLLAACYVLTRRLWFAIGVHMAWNFAQGGIFGVAVSGITIKGLFQSTLTGPEFLSGGSFGAEASLVAVIVCVSGFVLIILQAHRKGAIVQPSWMRGRPVPSPTA